MVELVFTKMYLFKLLIILFSLNFRENHCQRRIKGGKELAKENKDMGYVVYLLKSMTSPRRYENWLCGGAIVSPSYIVTSAACVTDVVHLYAIAGERKYVNETDIHDSVDSCAFSSKKKIVYTCIPKGYELDYHDPQKWSSIDIAVVKVESPYDFNAELEPGCSYKPAKITINYDSKYQQPGIDAIVLGWGHQNKYREDMAKGDFNEKALQFAPVVIQNKADCKEGYACYEGMATVIEKYMICTSDKGNLDDLGSQISMPQPGVQGCVDSNNDLRSNLPECKKTDAIGDHLIEAGNIRKNGKPTNLTVNGAKRKLNNLTNLRRNDETKYAQGICQNDHGGPLVTWVGAHQVLIGVASAFRVSGDLTCIGPYLYTSTQCNGAFLNCIVAPDLSEPNKPNNRIRRGNCKNFFNETGYELLEKHISWKDHPDGPADNERNSTTHTSVKNTTSNVTLNLKNSKEEGNKTDQMYNTTKFVTNTNDSKG